MFSASSLDSTHHSSTPFHPLSLNTIHVAYWADQTSGPLSADPEIIKSCQSRNQNEGEMGEVSDAPQILCSVLGSVSLITRKTLSC